MKALDIVPGNKYGRLTVLGLDRPTKMGNYWKCLCDCGKTSSTLATRLRSGHTKSCGCSKYENNGRKRLPNNRGVITNIWNSYIGNSAKRNIEFKLTRDEFESFLSEPCFYCGKLHGSKHRIDGTDEYFFYTGIDRVDNLVGYTLQNCVPCCKDCNIKKNGIDPEMIQKLYKKLVDMGVLDDK